MRPKAEYEIFDPSSFGGVTPTQVDFESSRAVILPIPFERTTSYVPGTRRGPTAILEASTQIELWDEELGLDVHTFGIHTLPQMELPFETVEQALPEIQRVALQVINRDKFLLSLGGEHSITSALGAAAIERFPTLSVLQLDAHADLRESYLGSRFSHACAMRRLLDVLPPRQLTQVGIRNLSEEEAQFSASSGTRLFCDHNLRDREDWIERVIEGLGDPVYVSFDCDALDPAIMPAVGTPVPGGLTWREALSLLRATFERRTVVACDIVELCPSPVFVGSDFLCAKLAYKMLTYKLGIRRPEGRRS